MAKCEMPGPCPYPNETKGPYCSNCEANMAAWELRPTSDVTKRTQRLKLYAARMAAKGPSRKKGEKRKGRK